MLQSVWNQGHAFALESGPSSRSGNANSLALFRAESIGSGTGHLFEPYKSLLSWSFLSVLGQLSDMFDYGNLCFLPCLA